MIARTVSRRDFLRVRLVRPLVAAQPLAAEPVDMPAPSSRAQVLLANCLSQAYQTCSICVERCGARKAIALRSGLPVVDAARCTGCGECAHACPSPRPAIRMVARSPGAGGT